MASKGHACHSNGKIKQVGEMLITLPAGEPLAAQGEPSVLSAVRGMKDVSTFQSFGDSSYE